MPIALLLFFSSSANAARLIVEPESSFIFHLGAAFLLYVHIGGGAIGLLSGVVASLSSKGKKIHRIAGKIFYLSMLTCYFIGALVAPFLASEKSTNFVAAVLAMYLLITGVQASTRRNFIAGVVEKIGFVIALSITIMGLVFILLASQSINGTVDGAPPEAFILFVVAGTLATIGELRVILHKRLTQRSRIIRHIWRMCFSFFIASGSLFFGQAQLLPDWFNSSLLPLVFGLFPIVILLIGLFKTLKPLSFFRKAFIKNTKNRLINRPN